MMGKYKNTYRIESARLKGWDYSNPSWYYVTVCAKNMKCWFGEIKNGKMILNEIGKMISKFWEDIPNHYKAVELDYYTIMPNHIHGIIIINSVETGQCPVSTLRCNKPTLGNVIGSFKSAVTKWAHNNNFLNFKWQSRFYDHIIRNEEDLLRIRNYINNNPIKWEIDEYYNLKDIIT